MKFLTFQDNTPENLYDFICPLCGHKLEITYNEKIPHNLKCTHCKIEIGGPSIVAALKEYEEFAFFMKSKKKRNNEQRHQYHYTMNFDFQI